MRKMKHILLFSSLLLFLMGCMPTTSSNVEPAAEPETAVPALSTTAATLEPVPSETAVPPEIDPTATPTRSVDITAKPLPTIALEEEPMPSNPGNVVKSSPEKHPEAVSTAVEDLAGRLNIEESEIEAIAVEMVIWPDASLGCPHPDMAYKQVPQDGLRIRLRADGKIYAYHSGGVRPPFLCEKPANLIKPEPGSGDSAPPPGLGDT